MLWVGQKLLAKYQVGSSCAPHLVVAFLVGCLEYTCAMAIWCGCISVNVSLVFLLCYNSTGILSIASVVINGNAVLEC